MYNRKILQTRKYFRNFGLLENKFKTIYMNFQNFANYKKFNKNYNDEIIIANLSKSLGSFENFFGRKLVKNY